MDIEFSKIQDKQRILIIGNEGTEQIIKIALHVLNAIKKPADYLLLNGDKKIEEAPIILIQGDDHINQTNNVANFLRFKHHMALIHHIVDNSVQDDYTALNDYVEEYEKLAEQTPKGGSLFYNKEDDLVTLIGSKEIEDVRLTAYESLQLNKTDEGYQLPNGIKINTTDLNFPSHAGAVKELLGRIRVTENQFWTALESYKN